MPQDTEPGFYSEIWAGEMETVFFILNFIQSLKRFLSGTPGQALFQVHKLEVSKIGKH